MCALPLGVLGYFEEDLKRPTMNWLTAGMDPNVAYGMCIFLFGLLVLSVRTRNMATGIPYTFYASPSPRLARPAPVNKSTQRLQSAASPAQPSELLRNTGLEYTPRETTNNKVPDNSANWLAAPTDFPALGKSQEMKMDSAPIPPENPAPILPAEIPGLVPSVTESTIQQENISAVQNDNEFA